MIKCTKTGLNASWQAYGDCKWFLPNQNSIKKTSQEGSSHFFHSLTSLEKKKMNHVCLLQFFLFFNYLGCLHCCSREQMLGKFIFGCLVVSVGRVDFWQHYFQPLVSHWKHCILYAAVVSNYALSKPRSMQDFHSNPVACDRLKMKGYKSLPGWPWGLATVILKVWIQPKTSVAWHPDIFSVFFHCEVSNIPEMWLKLSFIKSITLIERVSWGCSFC